ncbi:MAG: DUF5667 domain-containing protein [Candidatus Gracilibacteria bacterium]
MKGELTDITGFLEGLNKPVLSEEKKLQMKSRIMAYIRVADRASEVSENESVISYIKKVAGLVGLTAYQRVTMKERILSYISTAKQSRFAWVGVLDLGKRLVGAFLIFAMVMGLFNFAGGSIQVASADSFTAIESLRGEVVIERAGDKYLAYDEMELEEGDKVYTGENGWVSIKFMDDSVARLREGSSVRIDKLFENPDNKSITNVEVEVDYGDMWTKVLSLFEEGSSFAVKAGSIQAVAKKAAFNVHIDGQQAVIEVYSNVVQIEDMKVKSGQKVEVELDSSRVTVADTDAKNDDWVQSNLESDRAHIAKVEESSGEQLKGAVGSLPESALYPFKSLKEGVVRFLTFDDINKQKIDLESSERKFVEWSLMMNEGDVGQGDAEKVFEEFVQEVDSFKSVIVNVRLNGDDEYANELKDYLKNNIAEAKDYLKTVLPTSPLYVAKEYLYEVEQASAESEIEKALIIRKQAASKLAEVQDLAEVGEKDLAEEVMSDYVEVSGGVEENVGALSDGTLSDEEVTEVQGALDEAMEDEKDMITSIEDAAKEDVAEVKVVGEEEGAAKAATIGQQTTDYGIPVLGVGENAKLLDPLLNLTR